MSGEHDLAAYGKPTVSRQVTALERLGLLQRAQALPAGRAGLQAAGAVAGRARRCSGRAARQATCRSWPAARAGLGMIPTRTTAEATRDVGVSVLGARCVTRVADHVASGLSGPGAGAAPGPPADGAIPDVDTLPAAVARVVEDAYGQAVGHTFLVAAPLMLLSVLRSCSPRRSRCASSPAPSW